MSATPDAPVAADALEFDPVVLRRRHDGWTPLRQRQFVEALADTGVVRRAAAAVGMTEQSVGRLRRRGDGHAFDRACDAAARIGARRLHAIAYERAIEGSIKRHYYHGELKSEERVYNDRLLIYLLGRTRHLIAPPERTDRVLQDWESWMEAIEEGRSEPPRGFTPPPTWEKGHWRDEYGVDWSDYPPPDDYDGIEHGEYGDPNYRRRLSAAEQAVIDADDAAERAARRAAAEARRDLYFSRGAPEVSSPLPAEPPAPFEPSIEPQDLGLAAETPSTVRPEPVEGPSFSDTLSPNGEGAAMAADPVPAAAAQAPPPRLRASARTQIGRGDAQTERRPTPIPPHPTPEALIFPPSSAMCPSAGAKSHLFRPGSI